MTAVLTYEVVGQGLAPAARIFVKIVFGSA